jgi:hypothetical protein
MDAELIIDKNYQKGFNEGYILAEHSPAIAKLVVNAKLPDNEYFSGFKAGREQFGAEKMREVMKSLPTPPKGQDKSKGMDKGK